MASMPGAPGKSNQQQVSSAGRYLEAAEWQFVVVEILSLLSRSMILGSGAGGDGDANGGLGCINGPGNIWMGGQLFGHRDGQLRPKIPEPRMPARFDQSHYPVANQ